MSRIADSRMSASSLAASLISPPAMARAAAGGCTCGRAGGQAVERVVRDTLRPGSMTDVCSSEAAVGRWACGSRGRADAGVPLEAAARRCDALVIGMTRERRPLAVVATYLCQS
eukprot:366490-Chlamydomonas_euryale.AAC.48